MYERILRDLLQKELLQPDEADRIRDFEANKPFSLHWELTTMLYVGVLLLNVGLGILIYENIDSIGHAAIIALIGGISAGCFWYAYRRRKPFSRGEVESPTPYYDYLLLLGCLTFLIMEGYWQYQYHIFGDQYGLATFIPMVLFFATAYLLDNRGVLSLGITLLASWAGIVVTPYNLLESNDFNSATIVITGVLLGILLAVIPFLGEKLDFKKHYSLTYLNFSVHLLMISCLAGMIALDQSAVYFPLLCLSVAFYLWYARTQGSFYFLTAAVLYGYIGFTWLLLNNAPGLDFSAYLLYFLVSCGGVIAFLMNYKKFFKTNL